MNVYNLISVAFYIPRARRSQRGCTWYLVNYSAVAGTDALQRTAW